MINIPGPEEQQVGQVPIPGRSQPFQQPPFKDPSDIIMGAAHLNLQREELQRQHQQDLMNTIQSSMNLLEKKREAEASEAHAGALLSLQQQMQGPKMEEAKATIGKIQAETANLQSQADLNNIFTKMGMASPDKTYGPKEKADTNAPTGIPQMMWDYMSKVHDEQASYGALRYTRGPLGQAAPFMQLMHSKYFPHDDMNAIEAKAAGEKAKASATGSLVGGKIEDFVRSEKSIQPSLSNMKNVAASLDPSQIRLLNSIKLGIEQQINDPKINAINTYAIEVGKEMSMLFPGNTGSDYQARNSMNVLSTVKSPQNLVDSINIIQMMAHDRVRGKQNLPTSPQLIRDAGGDKNKMMKALKDAGYIF